MALLMALTSSAPAYAEDFYGPNGAVMTGCAYYSDVSAPSGYRYACYTPEGYLVPVNPAVQYGGIVWGG